MTCEHIRMAAIKIDNIYNNIVTGKHHGECLAALKKATTQGFMADSYSGMRFVDRKEALEIAKAFGQKINKHSPKDELLSEDLKDDELFNR